MLLSINLKLHNYTIQITCNQLQCSTEYDCMVAAVCALQPFSPESGIEMLEESFFLATI